MRAIPSAVCPVNAALGCDKRLMRFHAALSLFELTGATDSICRYRCSAWLARRKTAPDHRAATARWLGSWFSNRTPLIEYTNQAAVQLPNDFALEIDRVVAGYFQNRQGSFGLGDFTKISKKKSIDDNSIGCQTKKMSEGFKEKIRLERILG